MYNISRKGTYVAQMVEKLTDFEGQELKPHQGSAHLMRKPSSHITYVRNQLSYLT